MIKYFSGCANGGGYIISYGETGGSYAGIMFGISNTFASLPGIILPEIIASVTKHVSYL